MCEATGNVNLAVFDVPVLEMSFSGDPAPYCDGDVLTFQDLNNDDAALFMSYDYWTNAGLRCHGRPQQQRDVLPAERRNHV